MHVPCADASPYAACLLGQEALAAGQFIVHVAPVTAANNGMAMITISPPLAVSETMMTLLFRDGAGALSEDGAPTVPTARAARNCLFAGAVLPASVPLVAEGCGEDSGEGGVRDEGPVNVRHAVGMGRMVGNDVIV